MDDVSTVGGADAEAWDAFSRIDDAEFDGDGNLTLLDTEASRVVVVGPNGAFLREVSRRGSGPGELRAPASITVMPDDRLVVYDIGHDALLTFDPRGAPRALGAPLLTGVLASGHVVVVDSTGYRVKFVAPDGSLAQAVERPIEPLPVTASIREAEMNRLAERRSSNAGQPSLGRAAFEQQPPLPRADQRNRIGSDGRTVGANDVRPRRSGCRRPGGGSGGPHYGSGRTASDGGADGPTDVLAHRGEYLGTLAADDFALPLAFGPNGLMAYAETDEHDAPLVRVVRLLALR